MSKQQKCQSYVNNISEDQYVSTGSAGDIRNNTFKNRPPIVRQARTSSYDNDNDDNGSNETRKEDLREIFILNKIEKNEITKNETESCERNRIKTDHLACGDQCNSKLMEPTQIKISERFVESDRCVVIKAPKMYSKARETFTAIASETEAHQTEKLHSEEGDNYRKGNKCCGYLFYHHNPVRKITPINEETEQDLIVDNHNVTEKASSVLDCLSIRSCWLTNQEDIEVFHTNTVVTRKAKCTDDCRTCTPPIISVQKQKISTPPIVGTEELKISTLPIVGMKNQKKSSTPPIMVTEKQEKSASLVMACTSPSNIATEEIRKTFKHQEVQTISWSLLKSSQHENISLQSYGSVVINDDNSNNFYLECMERNIAHSRKRSKYRHFYWLLRPFHGKYRKPKKSSAIQAIVYKTYFVKWTKPPETLTNGFGVRRNEAQTVWSSVLRRSRSAIF
uniref:Uncharacterized protein n=1 Tax=Glossina brevipalpis TaxID=37001 RepID=A0A1A9WKW8_9MUSC